MPRVYSLDEVAAETGLVRRTIDRLLAAGEGPSIIQLSARRIGVLDTDLTAWLQSRRRPAPGSATAPIDATTTDDPATPVKRGPGRPKKVV
ncbi:MAG: AlpA family phage regulatory protein [Alphaproteobacteria bacterium]|nr:AlpA family phage regulatory protein [Alphaproteobacteria bacterium]